MKKIAVLIFLMGLFIANSNVQAQKKNMKETTETKKDGTPDMRYKNNKVSKTKADKTSASKDTKKDGTPDIHYKNNKDAKVNTETKTSPVQTKTTTTSSTTKEIKNPKGTSNDKVVGTDSKGRTIYEGPRGGRYYLTIKGNKEYIKKEK